MKLFLYALIVLNMVFLVVSWYDKFYLIHEAIVFHNKMDPSETLEAIDGGIKYFTSNESQWNGPFHYLYE